MSDRDISGQHPEDMPWNDVPADSDVVPGSEEPDPAEVVGDEDDDAKRDSAAPPAHDRADQYTRETLDQRLAEEEPDRPERPASEGVGLIGAGGGDEASAAEPDEDDPTGGDEAAEESAMHMTDEA